ncbi:MAG: hypothetical protein JST54_21630 [Deltaproteobacteria bacterium]|nr:hypothetical protein [Deltaproteobacteria bacterium]
MKRLVLLALLLAPAAAQAKAWRNVTPGATPSTDVTKRFGEPTKRLKQGDKKIFAYEGDETIEGTTQAQFTIAADGKVEQIAIFPATVIERAALAETYGPDCKDKQVPNCFVQKVSDDDFKTYFWYPKLGLVVFLSNDGKTVQSLLFVKPEKAEQKAASKER